MQVTRKCARCGAPLKQWTSGKVCWRCMMEPEAGSDNGQRAPADSFPAALENGKGLRFGDYLLEEEIAHGGMGVVYRARQLSLGRAVAVKLLLLGRYSSADSVERFRREAQAVAALRHPNLVAIHEIGEHDGQQFFSMDYVDGPSLAQSLRQGPFEPRRAAEIVAAIARAMHYAHQQGVLHRDLKPSNVLLDAFGQVRITDFGLAKRLDGSSDLTVTGQVVGTPNYLSPEQAAGKHAKLGPTSDVYSVGALMYELLTGRPPFLANSLQDTLMQIQDREPVGPRALNPVVHRDLETICLKCLRKEPAKRYPAALSLAEDLERWLQHQPIEARPVGLAERGWLWAKRRPRQALMLAAAVTTLAALFVTLAVANLRIGVANQKTELKAAESLHRLAQLNVASGNRLVTDGDWASALLWFVEALRLEQGDPRLEEVHRRRIGAVMRMGPRLAQLFVHDGLLSSAELSADASRVATAGLNGTVQVWDSATGQARLGPLAHPNVRSAWFTRHGTHVLSLGHDGSFRIWDAQSGNPVGSPRQLTTTNATDTDFSGDGKWFAVPEEQGVELFDAATMRPCPQPLPLLGRANLVKFSPKASLLAVAEQTGHVRFWDLASDPPTNRILKLPMPAMDLAIDPSGKRLAVFFDLVNVQLWDTETGLPLGAPMAHPDSIHSLEFRPDGHWLATASWDGMVRLWDVETSKPGRAPLPHGSAVKFAKFTFDGSHLITATWNCSIRVWDPDSGQTICPLIRQVGFDPCISLVPDGTRLLVSSHDPAARLWQLPAASSARLTLRHNGAIQQGHFSPDGKLLLTSSLDGTAKLWDRATGNLLRSLPHPGPVHQSLFSPDGSTIATGSTDGSTRLWHTQTGVLRAQTSGQNGAISNLSFSADGSRLATGAADGTARVWRVSNGQPLTPLLTHSGATGAMFFSADGTRLVTGSEDGTARLWDATSGAPLGQLMQNPGPVKTVALSPDGRLLLTACWDASTLPYSAQLWEAKTCLPVGQPMPHMDGIKTAVFSPDGLRIVTGGEDNCAQIWSGTTGERLTPALLHHDFVYCAAFSPDGRLLLTTSGDATSRVWDPATGEPVTPPLPQHGRLRFGSWSPDGREVITCSDDGTALVWDVSPTQAPLAELQLQAEVMSAHYVKPSVGALPLSAKDIETRWRTLRQRLQPASQPYPSVH